MVRDISIDIWLCVARLYLVGPVKARMDSLQERDGSGIKIMKIGPQSSKSECKWTLDAGGYTGKWEGQLDLVVSSLGHICVGAMMSSAMVIWVEWELPYLSCADSDISYLIVGVVM